MTIIKNQYIGITHPLAMDERIGEKEHDLILKAWKNANCVQGVHLWDEVWSAEDHYLHCDACEMMVYIDKIEIPDGKNDEL